MKRNDLENKLSVNLVCLLLLGALANIFQTPLYAQSGDTGGGNCKEMGLEAATQKAVKLTTLLKIANFRADVNYMGEVAGELDKFLKTCGDDADGFLPLVCTYDCHIQLGRYHLFLASDFPYLSNASGVSRNDSPMSPQKAQEHAEDGIAVVERGLKILARQQGGSKNGEVSDSGFREFVRQMTLLNALKIRLYMNMGDNWYQTVSEASVKRMSFLLSSAIGQPGSSIENDPNLARAKGYYEKAMWAVIESTTDIPGESTYDDLRTDIYVLDRDLKIRLNSVQQGLLYLNIDPDQFTSINFQELSQKIEQLKLELAAVEGQVQSIVERWHQTKEGEATRQIDENRVVQGEQVNLIAHRIGKMESTAREYADTIREEINKVDGEKDTYEYRQRVRGLEMELERRMSEFEQRKKQIMNKKETDLILLSKEAEMEKRNELRWLLNWEMTQMNIDLQLESLATQIKEYNRQKSRNDNRLDILSAEDAQRIESLQVNQLKIDLANKTIDSLKVRKTQLYMDKRAVIRESICRIESELAYIGKPIGAPFTPIAGESACTVPTPTFTTIQFQQGMCGNNGANEGLRRKLVNQQINARAFLLKCILGPADFQGLEKFMAADDIIGTNGMTVPGPVTVDCGSFKTTETDFAKKIWEKEKGLSEAKKQDMIDNIKKYKDNLDYINGWVKKFLDGVVIAEAALTAVEITYQALAAVPETWVFAAGMTTGAATKVDAAKPALAVVDKIRDGLKRVMDIGRMEYDNEVRIKAGELELQRMQQALDNIDMEVALRALSLHEAHFQIAGRTASANQEIQELFLRNDMADLECKNGTSDIDNKVDGLVAEHKRLLATFNLEADQNQLIDYEIDAQNNYISRTQRENAILAIEQDKSTLQKDQLNTDNTVILDLIQSVQKRIDKVTTVKTKVEDLANASNMVTNVIGELREKQKDQMLALSDIEMNYVENRLNKEQSNTGEMITLLDKARDLGLMNRDLNGKILAFQKKTDEDISKEQDNLLTLVSKIDDPNQKKNLFIASEEVLSDLMKGIPEYLDSKKRILESANLTLHMMRRRYQLVSGLSGTQDSYPSTYVRNGTQLATLVADIENQHFFNERQINIDVAEIVIPSNSGLVRTLAKNEKVTFEISPDAVDPEGMAKMGYFVLWDKNKFGANRNLTVVDMMVGVQYACTGSQRNKFILTHKGQGSVFKSLSRNSPEVVPQLVVGPERSYVRPFYNLASGQDRMDRILDYWEDTFNVRNFPLLPGPPNDTRAVLPYLGAPVIGTYEIELRPGSCGVDDAVLTLYVIFASSI